MRLGRMWPLDASALHHPFFIPPVNALPFICCGRRYPPFREESLPRRTKTSVTYLALLRNSVRRPGSGASRCGLLKERRASTTILCLALPHLRAFSSLLELCSVSNEYVALREYSSFLMLLACWRSSEVCSVWDVSPVVI